MTRLTSVYVAIISGLLSVSTIAFRADDRPPMKDGGGSDTPLPDPPPDPAPGPADEAVAGFAGVTNGHLTQEQFDKAREIFEEREDVDEGLGPVYNAQSCVECHQNPVAGGISQITELRAGHWVFGGGTAGHRGKPRFVEAPGGSLINDRAIDASIQERVPDSENVRTFRTSLNTLGDGFVEAIGDQTFLDLACQQALASHGRIHGEIIRVPIAEAPGATGIGRFGWKDQHVSLLSFSADAYVNEMGITSPLQPVENTSMGRPVDDFDEVPDPDNNGDDVQAFADFMRATQPPPRDEALAATPAALAGAATFEAIGCGSCHTSTIVTAPAGTSINGGMFTVSPALGGKTIHPFGDFLLHDVGTGDGIVQNGGPGTANKLRTPPLWGVRTRSRLMHDGDSLTFRDAILRHRGEAESVTEEFRRLDQRRKQELFEFLRSL